MTHVEREASALFTQLNSRARGGCEGAVVPGVLDLEGQQHLAQIKRFYKETSDDRGEPFTQDPEEKVRESYETFSRLDELGFDVTPSYGILEHPNVGIVLVMEDLSRGGTLEVYDEKDWHHDRKTRHHVNGQEYETNTVASIEGLSNYREIHLKMLKITLLCIAHEISLGNGTSMHFVRNPETNIGDVFVSDVGEVSFDAKRNKLRQTLTSERVGKLLVFPEGEYEKTLDLLGPEQERDPIKAEYQRLFFQAAIGLGLRTWIGGWMKEAEFAKYRFIRTDLSEHWLKVKSWLADVETNFESTYGAQLFTSEGDQAAYDLAAFAVTDARLRQLMEVQASFQAGNPELPDMPKCKVAGGKPELVIFDDPWVEVPKSKAVEITVPASDVYRTPEVMFEVEYPIDQIRRWMDGYGHRYPDFQQKQIRGIKIGGQPVENFSSKKLRLVEPAPHSKYAEYDGNIVAVWWLLNSGANRLELQAQDR